VCVYIRLTACMFFSGDTVDIGLPRPYLSFVFVTVAIRVVQAVLFSTLSAFCLFH
jgi:hypothetical protein